jgi:hypothetical protein
MIVVQFVQRQRKPSGRRPKSAHFKCLSRDDNYLQLKELLRQFNALH